ncbi:MAG: hypothetical protein EBX30_15545 [Betaproteobacteria bacterium]|nr:hypothetical protein [Betaproteobacteria bacterium]NDG83309.1 hypothetical protein [Betaproteobacteria bacterium]
MRNLFDPFGKATVILMAGQFRSDMPTVAKIKKTLKVHGAAYYKPDYGHGWKIRKLEDLREAVKKIEQPGANHRVTNATDFILLGDWIYNNMFFATLAGPYFLDAFWITEDNLEQLQDALKYRSAFEYARARIHNFTSTLISQSEEYGKMGCTDKTVLAPPTEAISQLLDGYGNEALAEANQAVIDWYDRYRWRMHGEQLSAKVGLVDPVSDESQESSVPNEAAVPA